MKKSTKFILLIILNLIAIPVIVKFSYALNNDITSSTYVVNNNTIYATPTTYKYRLEELLANIESTYEIKVYNKDNEELELGDYVSTGCKVVVNNSTYSIILLGDLTLDGEISLGDVASLYNIYRGKKELSEDKIASGRITGNENITLGDVSKLYNYYKGKKAFTTYNKNMIDVDNIVDKAINSSKRTGKNIIDELNVEYGDNDQVVVTKEGKVEVAVKKDNDCYRKNALSNYIEVVDNEYCEVVVSNFVSNAGQLSVKNSKLIDQNNREIRLVGVNGGIYLKSEEGKAHYSTDKFFKSLKKWGTQVYRVFLETPYRDETSDTFNEYMDELYRLIDLTSNNDMYIILNWNPAGNGRDGLSSQAINVFNRVATKYKNDPHIIYEIWNEPNADTTWDDVKGHANIVIPAIRSISPNALILVGTPNFDKRVDAVINDELSYDNIMYTYHMYTPGVEDANIDYIIQALNNNIPVFVSEWGAVQGNPPQRGSYIDEAHALAFAKVLDKYNLSNLMFNTMRGWWSYNFIDGREHQFDENMPDSILTESAFLYKRLLRRDYSSSHHLMEENNEAVGKYYRSDEYKDKIVSVRFTNTINVPSNILVQWDLSLVKDNSIIGYLEPSTREGMYDLVISANGVINLPVSCRYLFSGLTNVESYDFNNVETNMTINLSYMFNGNKNLSSLDLSKFDVSRVRYMYATFNGDEKLTSVNMSGWNPPVQGLTNMFAGCSSYEELDLSGFDVSNTSDLNSVFAKMTSLRRLDISGWEPKEYKNIHLMFYRTTNIEYLDISGFNLLAEDLDLVDLFGTFPKEATIVVKNSEMKDAIENKYFDYFNVVVK
ncbi:MAG: BspA family leucine-rich repeat surface protein [Firmicutes bacterium]|nr:BspA family leucine-rich repeat surface protein [Bacillota bacterium]